MCAHVVDELRRSGRGGRRYLLAGAVVSERARRVRGHGAVALRLQRRVLHQRADHRLVRHAAQRLLVGRRLRGRGEERAADVVRAARQDVVRLGARVLVGGALVLRRRRRLLQAFRQPRLLAHELAVFPADLRSERISIMNIRLT